MQPAAEAMKLLLQSGQIEVQPRLESENRKIIADGRRLNLAAIGTKQRGFVVGNGTGPAGNRDRILEDFQHETAFTRVQSDKN
jgi:hypothetical protein